MRAWAWAGARSRTDPEYGHIFDHFAVEYEYPNGVHMHEHVPADRRLRQPRGRDVRGHEGRVRVRQRRQALRAHGASAWKFAETQTNPYVQEHTDLIASIRAGKPLNELQGRWPRAR